MIKEEISNSSSLGRLLVCLPTRTVALFCRTISTSNISRIDRGDDNDDDEAVSVVSALRVAATAVAIGTPAGLRALVLIKGSCLHVNALMTN